MRMRRMVGRARRNSLAASCLYNVMIISQFTIYLQKGIPDAEYAKGCGVYTLLTCR